MAGISFHTYFHFLESDLAITTFSVRFPKQLLNVLPTIQHSILVRECMV